jgi:hypothetical protein
MASAGSILLKNVAGGGKRVRAARTEPAGHIARTRAALAGSLRGRGAGLCPIQFELVGPSRFQLSDFLRASVGRLWRTGRERRSSSSARTEPLAGRAWSGPAAGKRRTWPADLRWRRRLLQLGRSHYIATCGYGVRIREIAARIGGEWRVSRRSQRRRRRTTGFAASITSVTAAIISVRPAGACRAADKCPPRPPPARPHAARRHRLCPVARRRDCISFLSTGWSASVQLVGRLGV